MTSNQNLQNRMLPVEERVPAGQHLGRLGDPRSGVCDLNIDWCAVSVSLTTASTRSGAGGAMRGGTFGSLGITVIHGHMPTMSIQ
jgi:hypothetical protein